MNNSTEHQLPQEKPLFQFFRSAKGVMLWYSINYFANPAVQFVAISSNTVNVLAFLRSGTKDGISIIFLSLSISDLLHNTAWFTERVLVGADLIHKQYPYHWLIWIGFFISRCTQMWYVISVLLTVFAAVQKCSCIALPLVFGHYFTRRRTVVVVVLIFTIVISYHIPGLSLYRWEEYFDKATNRTRLGYGWANRPLGLKLNIATDWINFISVPFISEGVITICVIIMTLKLREAATTRLKMTSGKAVIVDGNSDKENYQNSSETEGGYKNIENDRVDCRNNAEPMPNAHSKSYPVTNAHGVLNPRELRVIRSANLICLIFIIGTLPNLVITVCNLLFRPLFSDIGEQALYFTFKGIQTIIYDSSTAVNSFVYYKFNTKYRKAVNSMFSCFCKEVST
ncbi:chemosensory receptor C [Elysia marginata]|uniref:Chemosensory receptor C n=1 Tax=Elysia marginata TaxID=1093978 RepID=A0AAV4GHN4_9GAST|nr:chemosensory receptor C [Elysia marginata]